MSRHIDSSLFSTNGVIITDESSHGKLQNNEDIDVKRRNKSVNRKISWLSHDRQIAVWKLMKIMTSLNTLLGWIDFLMWDIKCVICIHSLLKDDIQHRSCFYQNCCVILTDARVVRHRYAWTDTDPWLFDKKLYKCYQPRSDQGLVGVDYIITHDDVIKWKHFPRYWPFVRRNSPATGEFPAQRPVTRSFDVFFDLRLKIGWVNNGEAGELRRHIVHYDVTVMFCGVWEKSLGKRSVGT